MSGLRKQPTRLAEYSAAVSKFSRIPVEHVVKDFWITESLRAMTAAAERERARLVFKGGTSLSKGYHLIHRFSEDIDLLCLAEGGRAPFTAPCEGSTLR